MLKFHIHCLQSKEAFLSIIFKIIEKNKEILGQLNNFWQYGRILFVCGLMDMLKFKCQIIFFILSASGSVLQKFLDETADMSSDDRAKHLEKNMVRKTCCQTFSLKLFFFKIIHQVLNFSFYTEIQTLRLTSFS